jgi:NAD(P)-dependent dehydrogenase (short-subunit alcohol dehydrogenase family)
MQSPMKRIALVTGANKGIGFEVARQLSASGCTLLLGARNKALGEEAAAMLKREGCDVQYVSIDLDDPATITAAAREIEKDFGHLDILVNNACLIGQGDGLPSSSSLDAIERAFRINFLATVAVTQVWRSGMDLRRREVSRLCRIEGSSQYAHRGTRLGAARHIDQSEFSRPMLHGNRSQPTSGDAVHPRRYGGDHSPGSAR